MEKEPEVNLHSFSEYCLCLNIEYLRTGILSHIYYFMLGQFLKIP